MRYAMRHPKGNSVKLNTPRLARVLVLFAAPVALAGCGVNTIPTQEEFAKAKWADVQNDYQRRADLIPNLVATVQGAVAGERGTLVAVQQARSAATQVKVDASSITDPAKFQQFQAAQDNLSGALGRLMVVSENYPTLRTNENFLALQSQLEGTENRITVARRDYNEAARIFNTTLHTFPGVLWASTVYHNEKPMQLFQANAAAQSAPTVNFNIGAPGVNGAPASGTAPVPGATPGSAPPATGGATTTTTTSSTGTTSNTTR